MNIMYEKRSWPDVQGQKAEKASPNQELNGMYFDEAPGVHIFEEICGVDGVDSAHACNIDTWILKT